MKKIANIPVNEVSIKRKLRSGPEPRRKSLPESPGDSKVPASDSHSGSIGEMSEAEKKPVTNQDAQQQITNQGEVLNQADKIAES